VLFWMSPGGIVSSLLMWLLAFFVSYGLPM
jgi:hypothetical protein